jgi:serine/threonine-protein kinase RCK2
MMSDNTDRAIPKLIDFGLARILTPGETTEEPFGTLGYVAPEVLRKEPYSFQCDLWSLGCIMYALLSGTLPFDHGEAQVTIRLTLESAVYFEMSCWLSVSDCAKDFLLKLLDKSQTQRITLE